MKQEFLNIEQFCHKISNKIKRFKKKEVELYFLYFWKFFTRVLWS